MQIIIRMMALVVVVAVTDSSLLWIDVPGAYAALLSKLVRNLVELESRCYLLLSIWNTLESRMALPPQGVGLGVLEASCSSIWKCALRSLVAKQGQPVV